MTKWTKEDIEQVEKFIEIKNRGYYADGKQLTEVYNRVLERNVNVTNCGSCLRGRVQELENALNAFKALSEKTKVEEPINTTTEENNATQPPKRVGKKKKTK